MDFDSFVPILKLRFLSVFKYAYLPITPGAGHKNWGSPEKIFGLVPKNIYSLRSRMWPLKKF